MNQYRKFVLQINGTAIFKSDDAQRLNTAEILAANTLTIAGKKYIKSSRLYYDEEERPQIIHNIITDKA